MDEERIRQVVVQQLSGYRDDLSLSLFIQNEKFPRLAGRWEKGPSICLACRDNKDLRATCVNFYNSLPKGDGVAKCPFGVTVLYEKNVRNEKEVVFCSRLLFDVSSLSEHIKTRTVRRVKKVLSREAKEASAISREGLKAEARAVLKEADLLMRLLLESKVYSALRGLAHQILTPAQGAIADLEGIPECRSKNALVYNLETLLALAKFIPVLLSDELIVNHQTISKVVVHDVIREITGSLLNKANEKQVIFRIGFNHGKKRVEAVSDQFYLVFSAILENALKYSFSGTNESQREVSIRFFEARNRMGVEVSNLGCAIDPDEISNGKIFEQGYRGRHSVDRQRTGTGTGLAVVKRICDAHDATISVNSTVTALTQIEGASVAKTIVTIEWPYYID
ncbi:MAG: sensor histidine kinase [Wenzhouxiangella sp.]